MTEPFNGPTATARQMSGLDADGKCVLSVLVKRTYRIEGSRCVLAEDQVPLRLDIETDDAAGGLLLADLDIYPWKLTTDIVVCGHAHSRTPRPEFVASVRVGEVSRSIAVIGERQCRLANGRLRISEPQPISKVPLRDDHAYGGRDATAEKGFQNPLAALAPLLGPGVDLSAATPFRYPRNPYGRGYLMSLTPETVDTLVLPNLEDPMDRLGPDRIAVGTPDRWPLMPIPASLGWLGLGRFPRTAFTGFVPPHAPIEQPPLDVARGWVPADAYEIAPWHQKVNLRWTSGASPGLSVPYLRGDEAVVLEGLHPTRDRVSFRLPGEVPVLKTDGRKGKLNPTSPVLHTVILEPDEDRVILVWRGAAVALRPYMEKELETMPFVAVFGEPSPQPLSR